MGGERRGKTLALTLGKEESPISRGWSPPVEVGGMKTLPVDVIGATQVPRLQHFVITRSLARDRIEEN